MQPLNTKGRVILEIRVVEMVYLAHFSPALLLWRNQSIDSQGKSMDRFLYDNNTGLKWVNSSVNGVPRFKYLKSVSKYDQTCRKKKIHLLNRSGAIASYRAEVTYLYQISREMQI